VSDRIHQDGTQRRINMAKPIELETILKGEEARRFHEYLENPNPQFTPESRALIEEARQLSKKWHD
jgi:hypothetical protein